MTVKLTSNFFANARGVTFIDGGGITWTINKNTNAITATGAGGAGIGTVTSVGLADTSTTAIYTVSNTPVTASGTIDITLKTQTAASVFAGPTTGSAAQPTFRAIVATDIPTLNQNTTGSSGSCTGNAATATTATNLAGGLAGSMPYQTGAGATTFLGIGSSLQVMVTNAGATAPSWVGQSTLAVGVATNIASGSANQIPYQTSGGVTSFFSAANYGIVSYGATGVPAAVAGAAGVLVGSASAIPAFTMNPTLTTLTVTGNQTWGSAAAGVTIAMVAATATGTALAFTGSNAGTNTDAGGAITVTGGTGLTSGNGGAVTITGGAAGSTGTGGLLTIAGGATTAGTGGGIAISAANAAASATAGGAVNIAAGNGVTSGGGGTVTIAAGISPSGTAGSIILKTGTTSSTSAITIAPNQNVTFGASIVLGTATVGANISMAAATATGTSLGINGSASGTNTNAGGTITITGGTGLTSGAGGAVILQGGAAGSTGNGGLASLLGGVTTAGTGGAVAVTAAPGVAAATAGGAVTITAGNGVTSGGGGNITLQSGLSPSGTAGSIFFSTGTTGTFNAVTISPNGGVTITLPGGGTAAALVLPASSATIPAISIAAGTVLTSQTAGVLEYDGVATYMTNETTAGRGLVPVEQYFHLTSNGSAITTIANFFGATSNIPLVANAYYEIEIVAYFAMGSTGTIVTWTLTNSAAPTFMDVAYEFSPITGIVSPPTPPTATALTGGILGGVTAAQTFVTGLLVASTNQYARFRILLKNGSGTSLKIQLTETTTTTGLTPAIGSFWRCKRIPAGNVGTFAA